MCGFRKLPVWNDARRLTLAAYQFMTDEGRQPQQAATAAEVRGACVELLATIQRLGEASKASREALDTAGGTVRRLTRLLDQAHRQGLIGTLELVLMMREAAAVNSALTLDTFLTAGSGS